MANFINGQIILTEEEKETFEECKRYISLPPSERERPKMADLFNGIGKYKDGDLTF